MSHARPRRRTVMALLLLGSGLALAARPAAHALVRSWTALEARHAWRSARARPMDVPATGAPIAWLQIPDCGMDTVVLQGGDAATLRRAPGMVRTPTATIISAHRDQHFRRLEGLRPGQPVTVQDRRGVTRHYTITEIEYLPRDAVAQRVREQRGGDWLLLITCHPFRQFGPAPNRLLAWALAPPGA